MSCKKFSDSFILDYLRGKTQRVYTEAFTTHAEACPRCQARLEELKSLLAKIDKLAAATHIEPTAAMKGRLMERANELLPQREKAPRRRPRIIPIFGTALRYAAAAVFILAVWWVVDAMRGSAPRTGVDVVAATISDVEGPLRIERTSQDTKAEGTRVSSGDLIVTGSEPAAFTYNNSSRIRLYPNSAVMVGSEQNGEMSVLKLQRGEMRADSCECSKGVRIITRCGTIDCVGEGEFSLKVEPNGKVRLTVYKGNAKVCCPRCGRGRREVQAGETTTLSETTLGCREGNGADGERCGCD